MDLSNQDPESTLHQLSLSLSHPSPHCRTIYLSYPLFFSKKKCFFKILWGRFFSYSKSVMNPIVMEFEFWGYQNHNLEPGVCFPLWKKKNIALHTTSGLVVEIIALFGWQIHRWSKKPDFFSNLKGNTLPVISGQVGVIIWISAFKINLKTKQKKNQFTDGFVPERFREESWSVHLLAALEFTHCLFQKVLLLTVVMSLQNIELTEFRKAAE